MRLLEEVGDDLERAKLVAAAALPHAAAASSSARATCSTSPSGSWRKRSPIDAEERRIAGGQEAVFALASRVVLDPLACQRLGHLARGLLGREDERHVAPEHALEDRPDQRIVRAAEDDRVHVRLLERRRVLAHGLGRLGREGIGALDQRNEARAGDGEELDARIERVNERGVTPGSDGRLGREQPDAAVAGRLHGGVGLGSDHADDRNVQALLQLRQRRGGRRVAGRDDQLDALLLEVAADLGGEAA